MLESGTLYGLVDSGRIVEPADIFPSVIELDIPMLESDRTIKLHHDCRIEQKLGMFCRVPRTPLALISFCDMCLTAPIDRPTIELSPATSPSPEPTTRRASPLVRTDTSLSGFIHREASHQLRAPHRLRCYHQHCRNIHNELGRPSRVARVKPFTAHTTPAIQLRRLRFQLDHPSFSCSLPSQPHLTEFSKHVQTSLTARAGSVHCPACRWTRRALLPLLPATAVWLVVATISPSYPSSSSSICSHTNLPSIVIITTIVTFTSPSDSAPTIHFGFLFFQKSPSTLPACTLLTVYPHQTSLQTPQPGVVLKRKSKSSSTSVKATSPHLTMAGQAKQFANRLRSEQQGSSAPPSTASQSSSRVSSSSGAATQSPPSRSHTGGSRLRAIEQYDGGSARASSSGSAPGSPKLGPTRDPAIAPPAVEMKNVDLPVSAWKMINSVELSASAMPPRPKASTLGVPVKVALNTFVVESLPTPVVYQFDVMVGSGAEKRGLILKCWNSRAVQQALGSAKFIFDGNKLAWSDKPITREQRIQVDLDAEEGRTVKPGGKENKHRVVIRQTNTVDFAALNSFMSGQGSFDNAVLEAVNFFDHLLRELPSKRFTAIKRSLFMRGSGPRVNLGGAIEALKGAYQSVRVVHSLAGARLSINVDVNNSAFFKSMRLIDAICEMVGARSGADLVPRFAQGDKSRAVQDLNRFRKVRILAQHRGKEDEYVIDRFVFQSAKDYKFEKDGVKISIYDYFAKTYNFKLSFPNLPLVKMTKKGGPVLPMEGLVIKENQRYPFKLSEGQTSNMIKVAATPPKDRLEAIENSLKMLDWPNDKALQHYGVRINTNKTIVNGRLLPAPKVQFGTGEAKPGTSGRWDLKGKKFLTANTVPLKSWGVCVVQARRGGKPDRNVVENFIKEFIRIYIGHGGRVENKQPAFCLTSTDDVAQWVTSVWNAAGNASQARPQMLVFILPDKDANTYGRIKRSAECRYGVVSQCMQYAHVMKAQPQYISNVCMKFNAKLGGSTARAIGAKTGGPTGIFSVPTVVIGADVSHSAPGAKTPSMAAMTVSLDKLAIRYAGACETNGFRVEMITTDNINSMLKPQLKQWMSNVGGGRVPQRLFYFRDGVSEGQFTHVLQQEVHDMKALLKSADPNSKTQFVVVVAGKRHHIRMFPEPGKGDRNGNPFPGTLVETGVTHPFENDFYLCGHAAIKGTARPTHYSVLLNEANISNEELQTLIYEHGYQYIRATTPVSIHPSIYYAHLVSGRAIPHDPKWVGSTDGTPTQTPGPAGGSQGDSSSAPNYNPDKLMPMPNQGNVVSSMWYI
nr:protein argonaute [Quercus suber]